MKTGLSSTLETSHLNKAANAKPMIPLKAANAKPMPPLIEEEFNSHNRETFRSLWSCQQVQGGP